MSQITVGPIDSNPTTSQTIHNASSGGLSLQNIDCSSLNVFTQNNAACASAFNTIILNSPSGSSANNLRKALNIFYQGSLSNAAAVYYNALQINMFGLIDGTTQAAAAMRPIEIQFGATANGASSFTGKSAVGVTVQPHLDGLTGGVIESFLSFAPQFTNGATTQYLFGYNCDHAAISNTQITVANLCFTGYVGAGGWAGDFSGPAAGSGGAAAFAGRLCHDTDAIANGGTPTDCWHTGTGSPNSVVTANVGSFYAQTDGGAGTSTWFKEIGSGNTGWVRRSQITPVVFSSLPACAAGTEGMSMSVTDSNTNTWGANVAGSSTNHVLAYCDGTNWTVAAK